MSARKPKALSVPHQTAARAAPATVPSGVLMRPKLPPGKTASQDVATVLAEGIAANAVATREWNRATTQTSLTDLYHAVDAMGQRVNDGDLAGVEKLLTSQLVTLNAVFVEMLQRAHRSKQMEQLEGYMRLGLRAQSQYRATAETLATMKMPPVFAKNYQANIANGPQQVNNGTLAPGEIREAAPTKLLEAVIEAERVNTGTAGAAAGRDSGVETVDAVNGAAHGKRKGARGSKRVQGGRTAAGPRRRA